MNITPYASVKGRFRMDSNLLEGSSTQSQPRLSSE
jgi:hypothetical protein